MKKKLIATLLCVGLLAGCGATGTGAPADTSATEAATSAAEADTSTDTSAAEADTSTDTSAAEADTSTDTSTAEEAPEGDKWAELKAGFDGNLHMENGMAQPMLEYTTARSASYTNENSDILRYCVYVETDHDTDSDGMNDLVKAYIQVPRGAAEGKFKAGTIYDPTPYGAGTVTENINSAEKVYYEKEFDYDTLYKEGKTRTPAGEMTTLEAAASADSQDWNYSVPNGQTTKIGYSWGEMYDYYLTRGFAVVDACGIGTAGSEGYELCGMDLERDSHKAVVEWLAGDRRAFTDKKQNIEIKADWSNGKVAMTGCSYGGTIPFEVATTGVKGLETIIPYAGIASWYEYTNHQGVPIINSVNYADTLSAFNCGGLFLDDNWTVLDDGYCSWLWQIAQDQAETNGDYAPIWDSMNYTNDYANINCSALIVQGLNDINVTTKHADLMYQSFKKAGKPVKMFLHQDGHNITDGLIVNGELWDETINRWLSHYLYGEDNGIEDMAEVTVQSNVDGSYRTYDSWGDFKYSDLSVSYDEDVTEVSTRDLALYAKTYLLAQGSEDESLFEAMDPFYMSLDPKNVAVYDIDMPADGTICGVPEIHVKLSTDEVDYDGLMVTAVLMDTAEDGKDFKAFMTKDRLSNTLPYTTVDAYEKYEGDQSPIKEFVQSRTKQKCVSFAWTDLCNPGKGPDASEYTESKDLEADKYYDYTFYMLPTVYTVPEGHTLKLLLMTWDPYRVFLDEDFNLNTAEPGQISEYDYSYKIDNTSINVRMPLAD